MYVYDTRAHTRELTSKVVALVTPSISITLLVTIVCLISLFELGDGDGIENSRDKTSEDSKTSVVPEARERECDVMNVTEGEFTDIYTSNGMIFLTM